MKNDPAEMSEIAGVNWLAHVLADNVGRNEWVDKTPDELEASKAQGIDYPMKVIEHPIPEGKTIKLEDKTTIKCDSLRTRNLVIGLGKLIRKQEKEIGDYRRQIENTKVHPCPLNGPVQPEEKDFEVHLTDEQSASFASLRRRIQAKTSSDGVAHLVEMVHDRLDRGYWRYLAMTAVTQGIASHFEFQKNYPDKADPNDLQVLISHLQELGAGAGELSPQQLFEKWAEIWHKETMMMSFGHLRHWAYFSIMSLGEQAIPWILERYRNHIHIKWHMVLSLLTGENPTEPKDQKQVATMIAFDVRAINQSWIEWGIAKGHIKAE